MEVNKNYQPQCLLFQVSTHVLELSIHPRKESRLYQKLATTFVLTVMWRSLWQQTTSVGTAINTMCKIADRVKVAWRIPSTVPTALLCRVRLKKSKIRYTNSSVIASIVQTTAKQQATSAIWVTIAIDCGLRCWLCCSCGDTREAREAGKEKGYPNEHFGVEERTRTLGCILPDRENEDRDARMASFWADHSQTYILFLSTRCLELTDNIDKVQLPTALTRAERAGDGFLLTQYERATSTRAKLIWHKPITSKHPLISI